MTLTRRMILQGLGATAILPALPALAAGPNSRRFLFVYNPGGWDPLAALAPLYDAPGVQMPPVSGPARSGDLDWVDAGAPAVRAFFDAWHTKTHLLHGLSVPSVSHDVCTRLSLTGRVSGDRPDWPTLIGHADAAPRVIPSFVLGGPSFPADLGAASARAGGNGQLQALLDGSVFDRTDEPLPPALSPATTRLLDRYTVARTGAAATSPLAASWHSATERAQALRTASFDLSFAAGADLGGQLDLATTLLQRGLSRCVTVSTGSYGGWDTHQDNDNQQLGLFQVLMSALDVLLRRLSTTPGDAAPTLLDEVTVVVLSEMSRTPNYNGNNGRDHWPFTSVMLLGAGVTGGRTTGAFDDAYVGAPIDLRSGQRDARGTVPTVDHLGATLLALADVDPAEHLPGIDPLSSVMA